MSAAEKTSPAPDAPMIEFALDYARRGWPAFPCKPTDKWRVESCNNQSGDDLPLVATLATRNDRRADGIAVRRVGSRS